MGGATEARLEAALRAALDPESLRLADESERHRGHAGAREGGGHFRVWIVSERFAGRSRVDRHRMVYEAVRGELAGAVHALAIHAFTPEEWRRRAERPG